MPKRNPRKARQLAEIAVDEVLAKPVPRHMSRILQTPEALQILQARLADGNVPQRAQTTIAKILLILEARVDDLTQSGVSDEAIQDLMGILAALTGTLERLGRVGINLGSLDTGGQEGREQLQLLLLETAERVLTWKAPQRGLALVRARLARARGER